MFQFPFGTMHQLNLDWFLQQWQQLRQDWIDEEQHIDESMQDVYDARDAAIQAKDDAVSAKNDAESAQAGVHADALMAEGYAVGEQNGTPVGPGSPYYQVNAKFYSTNAGTYRYLSEAYARGTMGGTPVDPGDAGYEDNSKYYKEQADLDAQSASDDAAFAAADALQTEGYAVGEQNGTPVSSGSPYYQNNAKYFYQQTAQDKSDTDTLKDAANQAALRAEGFAVGEQNGSAVTPGSPYYQNNAEYYSSLAAAGSGIALAGIPFFDDFTYTTDGTVITAANQQQIVFTKNKMTMTRLGTGSTYYIVSLFGNHHQAPGTTPFQLRVEDLYTIGSPDADTLNDIVFYIKTKNHTSTETATPTIIFGTYNNDTSTWSTNTLSVIGAGETTRNRVYSLRKYLPDVFTNGNLTISIRIRTGATCDVVYSLAYSCNYYDPLVP